MNGMMRLSLGPGLETIAPFKIKSFLRRSQRSPLEMGRRQFWETPWLDGRQTKDIAPLIMERSKWKKCTINKATHGHFWITKWSLADHIVQFAKFGRCFK
jgi:hypothetical protein